MTFTALRSLVASLLVVVCTVATAVAQTTGAFTGVGDPPVVMSLNGAETFSIQLSGTFDGAVWVEASNDGDEWHALPVEPQGDPGASIRLPAEPGVYAGAVVALDIRVRPQRLDSGSLDFTVLRGAVGGGGGGLGGPLSLQSSTSDVGDFDLEFDGTAATVNTGAADAGTQRVVLADESLTAIGSSDLTLGGTPAAVNAGAADTGTQRVVLADENLTALGNSDVTFAGTAATVNAGAADNGTQRVVLADENLTALSGNDLTLGGVAAAVNTGAANASTPRVVLADESVAALDNTDVTFGGTAASTNAGTTDAATQRVVLADETVAALGGSDLTFGGVAASTDAGLSDAQTQRVILAPYPPSNVVAANVALFTSAGTSTMDEASRSVRAGLIDASGDLVTDDAIDAVRTSMRDAGGDLVTADPANAVRTMDVDDAGGYVPARVRGLYDPAAADCVVGEPCDIRTTIDGRVLAAVDAAAGALDLTDNLLSGVGDVVSYRLPRGHDTVQVDVGTGIEPGAGLQRRLIDGSAVALPMFLMDLAGVLSGTSNAGLTAPGRAQVTLSAGDVAATVAIEVVPFGVPSGSVVTIDSWSTTTPTTSETESSTLQVYRLDDRPAAENYTFASPTSAPLYIHGWSITSDEVINGYEVYTSTNPSCRYDVGDFTARSLYSGNWGQRIPWTGDHVDQGRYLPMVITPGEHGCLHQVWPGQRAGAVWFSESPIGPTASIALEGGSAAATYGPIRSRGSGDSSAGDAGVVLVPGVAGEALILHSGHVGLADAGGLTIVRVYAGTGGVCPAPALNDTLVERRLLVEATSVPFSVQPPQALPEGEPICGAKTFGAAGTAWMSVDYSSQ